MTPCTRGHPPGPRQDTESNSKKIQMFVRSRSRARGSLIPAGVETRIPNGGCNSVTQEPKCGLAKQRKRSLHEKKKKLDLRYAHGKGEQQCGTGQGQNASLHARSQTFHRSCATVGKGFHEPAHQRVHFFNGSATHVRDVCRVRSANVEGCDFALCVLAVSYRNWSEFPTVQAVWSP